MPPLPDLEAWAIFAKIAETKSFARAATDLNLSKATVSKAVSRLEKRIGASLLNRTSRRLSLTDTGRSALAGAARILAAGEAVEADALSEGVDPRGLVRLTAPMSFGIGHIAPLLPELHLAYPNITIDLHLSDEVVELVGAGFDLALRIADLADSTLRTRRLCQVRRLLVGAPSYFTRRGRPKHPQDLLHHACLGYAHLPTPDRWRFINGSGGEVTIAFTGPLRANNADVLHPMVLAGLGLSIQPEFLVTDHLAAGRLEVAMTDWFMPPTSLNIVTPPGTQRSARISAVVDFLARHLVATPWAISDSQD